MTEQLMHYAAQPIGLIREWPYTQHEPRTFGKPEGFWVSVTGEDDWPSWCRDNNYGVDSLTHHHAVTLAADAHILRIATPEGLDTFHDAYAVETEWERRWQERRKSWPIDWQRVAEDFDGIIIAPYQWSRRNSADWYYGWDCASGCIWASAAIAHVQQADPSHCPQL